MYEPVSFVSTVRFRPVSVWVRVTSTPGKTAPLGSLTVPLIWAVDCAQTTAQVIAESRYPKNTILVARHFISESSTAALARGHYPTSRFVHLKRLRRTIDGTNNLV